MIPPKANSAFVAAMEDVLAVYTRPHDPDRPLVCLDETSKQLIAETRVPVAYTVRGEGAGEVRASVAVLDAAGRPLSTQLALVYVLSTRTGVFHGNTDPLDLAVASVERAHAAGRITDADYVTAVEAAAASGARETYSSTLGHRHRAVEGRILRLTFLGADTYAPLLGRVARQAGVDYNILSGRIDRIRETPYGQLVVALVGGDADAAQRAFADAGVTVEVLRP